MMSDLIEYSQPGYKHANRGHSFILVVIDVFSKMVYTRPIKRKNKFEMAKGIQSILSEFQYFPNTLITDEGLEYYNKDVREVLDKYGIHHYSIKTKMKASVVERVNRTLKERLEKYFYTNKTKKWIDVLDQITSNYNNTPHRSIGMAPSQVTESNSAAIFHKMFPDIKLEVKPRLAVGNIVRVVLDKALFEKGYKQRWTEQLYQIIDVKSTAGRTWYKIADIAGNIIPGIKYFWQLNLIAKHDRELDTR